MIVAMEFLGQRRKVTVHDPSLLKIFTEGFKGPNDRPPQGGLTYHLKIKLTCGKEFLATAYIYDSLDGFALAIPDRFGFKDPTYRDVSFESVTNTVHKLFQALSQSEPPGREVTF